jgi:hypothetical protein
VKFYGLRIGVTDFTHAFIKPFQVRRHPRQFNLPASDFNNSRTLFAQTDHSAHPGREFLTKFLCNHKFFSFQFVRPIKDIDGGACFVFSFCFNSFSTQHICQLPASL